MTNQKKYQASHPWLTFQIDLRRAPAQLWMLMGEAKSKCEHIAGAPLQPHLQQEFHKVYLAKGVRATTAIEGNTLTENEVRQQIDGNLDVPQSKQYLKQEIKNIIDACNEIQDSVLKDGKTPLSIDQILQYHRVILKDLVCETHVLPGQFRTASVGVGSYRGAPAEDCQFLTERLCDWLNNRNRNEAPLDEISSGILCAIIAHIYIAWIHPFGDGNGRLARLIEFRLMLEAGIPTPACHLLSDHYNNTRSEYYRQLDEASKSKGDIIPFLIYAFQGLTDGLKEQVNRIKEQQYVVSWINFVHEKMSSHDNAAGKRSRDLVLELSMQPKPIPTREMMSFTPRVAKMYHDKTERTLRRDIRLLLKTGLIRPERKGRGWVPNKDVILAFLPERSVNPNASPKQTQ
jgi:Fic family protein